MPVPADETYLHCYGYMDIDEARELDTRAAEFLASRQWTTDQVTYDSQQEPVEPDETPLWSIDFGLGLDHIKGNAVDWQNDIIALLDFLKTVQSKLDNEFHVEVAYTAKLWYSEHIEIIYGEPIDYPVICEMIERVVP